MSARGHVGERGQVLVMAAAVMALLFVPLCVFLVDTGLVEASYGQLGETLQASVEDGARRSISRRSARVGAGRPCSTSRRRDRSASARWRRAGCPAWKW